MHHIWSIARKELRAYFGSPVALIFLGLFLAMTLFVFFWWDGLFARNLADVRPLFERLPLLLIFLVAAITMRTWSEEQKSGTIEILLTLPVPLHRLVLGKFLAGMILIGIALLLTVGLPITVSMMGDIDWGPVLGSYLAALLLAAAYLSIGLCASAVTDNQIISLFLSGVACILFYFPGSVGSRRVLGASLQYTMSKLGTGSRFESIARGVIDLRDLVFFASIAVFFLALNTLILHAKRWSRGARSRRKRTNAIVAVALIFGNLAALNLWLAPLTAARADITEHGEFSLSEVTEELLESLDEPLLIRGYFSKKTHPLLDPLVPQVKDLLAEYQIVGGGNVRVEYVDPSEDDDLQFQALEQYGIESAAFQFETRRGQELVNGYFHILIEYGDQHKVLDYNDLIELRQTGIDDVEIKLRNLEYDVTKTIKKVVYSFQSLDVLFASLPGTVELTAYISSGSLPEDLVEFDAAVDKVGAELQTESGGKLVFKRENPTTAEQQQALYQQYGIRPMPKALLSDDYFYFHLLLKVGDRTALIPPPEHQTAESLKKSLTEALERTAPGFVKTVGIVTPKPGQAQPQMPGMPPQQSPPPQSFRLLQQRIADTYEVRPVNLTSGRVGDEIDVLILAGPDGMTETEQKAVDQFLMRGGALIVLAGRYRFDIAGRDLAVESVTTGLEDLLASWGVEVADSMIMDGQSDALPIPVVETRGGLRIQRLQRLDYPYFVKVGAEGFAEDNIVTADIGSAIFHWASPVVVKETGDSELPREVLTLAESSSDSWLSSDLDVRPNFETHPKTGFGRPAEVPEGERGPHALIVSVSGAFKSHFAGKDKKGEGTQTDEAAPKDSSEHLLEQSPPDTRLIVAGSSCFAADELITLSRQASTGEALGNVELLQNLVDWAVEDVELLSIRSRGSHSRLLRIKDDEQSKWEWINYAIAALGFFAVVGVSLLRRRSIVPLDLSITASTPLPAMTDDDTAADDEEENVSGDGEDSDRNR